MKRLRYRLPARRDWLFLLAGIIIALLCVEA